MKPRLIQNNRKLQSLFRHGDLFIRMASPKEGMVTVLSGRKGKIFHYLGLAVRRNYCGDIVLCENQSSGVWARSDWPES